MWPWWTVLFAPIFWVKGFFGRQPEPPPVEPTQPGPDEDQEGKP